MNLLCTGGARSVEHRMESNARRFASRVTRLFLMILLAIVTGASVRAAAVSSAFDDASKLYEQGRFADAATAFERILQTGQASAALYFNLGNAWFKSGQLGRAISYYRLAEQLAPRDPDIRANLQFARNNVSGGATRPADRWRRWTGRLTLNEWTALATGALWLWFVLLALGRLRPALRKSLRGYTATAGAVTGLLAVGLAMAGYDRLVVRRAIVINRESVVRYGPLEESQSFYTARDGAELTVGDQQNGWIEVTDAAGRKGWLRRDQVLLFPPAPRPHG